MDIAAGTAQEWLLLQARLKAGYCCRHFSRVDIAAGIAQEWILLQSLLKAGYCCLDKQTQETYMIAFPPIYFFLKGIKL